jgi:DNA-directed RNA polymerase subunit RPC12/RpoP
MSDTSIPFSIPTDQDGFVTFQCIFCEDKFKLAASEIQQDEIIQIFCPYCGLSHEPSYFLSDDVVEHAQILVMNHVQELLNGFGADLERQFRNDKNISFKATGKFESEEETLLFEKEEMELKVFECCNRSVKINLLRKQIGVYCPYCGVN